MTTIKNTEIHLQCPQCKNNTYITDINKQETYCTRCGLIIHQPYPYTAGKKLQTLSNIIGDIK